MWRCTCCIFVSKWSDITLGDIFTYSGTAARTGITTPQRAKVMIAKWKRMLDLVTRTNDLGKMNAQEVKEGL